MRPGPARPTSAFYWPGQVALAGKKVIYIDSEGVSMERLRQVSRSRLRRGAKKDTCSARSTRFNEQETMVDKAIKLAEGTRTSA